MSRKDHERLEQQTTMKRTKTIILLFAFAALSLLPVLGSSQDYTIGVGDLVRMTVYDNPDLTFEGRVSGEGKINFPLIGEVVLKDLTEREAEKKITALLENGYIMKPQVSLFIQEAKAFFVFVNGEVRSPGSYKITKGLTVMKAITLAGGFTEKAGQSKVKILRKTEKGQITIKAKMDDPVLADDVILVPESLF